ncbi:hypothetical protein FZEAL_2189 [Fusarium zealandicum]|uniref:DUF3669 domain-containing protein n=1 Tax=Fusarium zealandicum TaxID=1053134 RepID=A0A8H4URD5_9HYPO|nr:hypothetical protein FZEAL_2189 [Fusarium zealandicum]
MHLNQLIDLQFEASTIASSMGSALAVMHWAAQTDARDVEFVLGSTIQPVRSLSAAEAALLPPNTWTGSPSDNLEDFLEINAAIWVLDFNQVRPITMDEDGVALAVEAYKINDPYFPKPLRDDPMAKKLWNTFATTYFEASQRILKDEARRIRVLPVRFLEEVIEMQKGRNLRGMTSEEGL